MIKTQTKEENKFMKRILPHYYKYVSENPNTLLVRILAMHRVKMYHLRRKVHFVIMSSVFDTPEEIHSIYDLKGSLIGRHATEKEKASGGVLKDLDLLESKTKFKLGSKKGKFIEQLRKDAMFLASLNIMDYSLLVGTHDRSKRVYAEDLKDDSSLSASMSHSAHDHPIIGSNTPFRRQSLLHVAQPPAIGSNENSNSMAGANPTEQSMGIAIPASAGSPRRRSMSRDRVRTTSKCENDSKDSPRQADPALSPGGASTSGGDGSIGIHTNEIELTECEEEDAEDEEDSEEEPDDVSYVSDEGDSDLEADLALQSQELPLEEMPFSPTQLQALEKKKRQSFEEESHFHRNSSARSSEGKFLTSPPSSGSIEAMGVDRILGDEVTQSPSPHTVPSPQQQNVEDNGVETFGLGATKLHPWTSRVDGGINSRLKDGTRGNEIYYMGVIDILQQYNTSKMIESLFKVECF